MALSLREQILARLAVVIRLSGIESALRNVDALDDTKLPAVVLHDGDEETPDGNDARAPGAAGGPMMMLPNIKILFGTTPELLGTEGNRWLAALQKAVINDTTLKALCGRVPGAGAHYVRMNLAMYEGSDAKGELNAGFSIIYPFAPSRLP